MPKVTGPLFSLQASGAFMGAMEFRKRGTETVVSGIKAKPKTRSAAQMAQSLRFAQAVAGWRALDSAGKLAWKTAGEAAGTAGYRLYLSEYQTQGIIPPDQPVIP